MSPYYYREDVAMADAAFEAWGATLEELFVAAADATTNTMAENLEGIEELIYLKDAEGLLLRVPAVRIRRRDGALLLEAEARGEPLDPSRHRLQADVKAVTLHRLRVERTPRGWEASVVLDI